jgi:hypothetical protein
MNNKGLAGCGCLVIVLVVIMVLTGALIHPITLRFMGDQFRYEDKIFTSDAIFVPRFPEDKNGELYVEAFREYSLGNGKVILVEDDTVLGTSVVELVSRMAKTRNLKDGAIRKIVGQGEGLVKAQKMREQVERQGLRKVIVLVPEYASRRFHLMYNSSKTDGKALYLIKPAHMTYFKKDSWWKESDSRDAITNEAFAIGSYFVQRFKYGETEKKDSKKR